jgi:predicted O-methyltransferase YrrM
LQDATYLPAFKLLSRFRESVINHPQILQIEDHGAGSKVMSDDERHSFQILKHNCSTEKRTQLLYRICKYFKSQRVLELGTSLGIGTSAMATAATQVTSVEASPEVARYAQQRLTEFELNNVDLVTGTFENYLAGNAAIKPSGNYDLIFMDGHHDGTATIQYFEQLLPFTNENSMVIIDDIYWSTGMTTAWDQLCKHPMVTASVDTYQWGILFFRPQQRQQRFYIKV